MAIDSAYATIISIFPRKLIEYKPGLQPSEYVIPAGNMEKPGLLLIGDDVHYLMNPDPLSDGKDVRQIKVPVKAMEAATSVIMDYITALICFETGQQPGLFCVKGGYDDPLIIKNQFNKELVAYNDMQNKWFQALVLMADEIWAKTRSPQGISDLQRDACKHLHIERDWLISSSSIDMNKCPYCMSFVNVGAIFCATCRHVLDQERYNKLNLQRANA